MRKIRHFDCCKLAVSPNNHGSGIALFPKLQEGSRANLLLEGLFIFRNLNFYDVTEFVEVNSTRTEKRKMLVTARSSSKVSLN